MGTIFIGTSAFSEPGWRGRFYPAGLPEQRMLAHYASRLNAVEVNSTLYRMPTPDGLRAWAEQVPDGFRFAIKAPRRVGLLPGAPLDRLLAVLPALGDRLGPVLFQTPAFQHVDAGALEALLDRLPRALQAVFDFHHPSWQREPAVERLLRQAGAARAGLDADSGEVTAIPGSACVYHRLRRRAFATHAWASRLRAEAEQGLDVYAFVKHEADADSPQRAVALAQEVARSPAYR
ncbi:MAG TPA: DUF72 domain-containing protein [Bacillota bacterium]|nr:DUF72 domain-containing protein [Bacillota bacterium]